VLTSAIVACRHELFLTDDLELVDIEIRYHLDIVDVTAATRRMYFFSAT
jgi:hypothetical protein